MLDIEFQFHGKKGVLFFLVRVAQLGTPRCFLKKKGEKNTRIAPPRWIFRRTAAAATGRRAAL